MTLKTNAPAIRPAVTAPQTPVSDDAPASSYRDLSASTNLAWDPKTSFTNVGDSLKPIQSDLQNAGYYPAGSSYAKEVDGKYGPKTSNAVKQLQSDLKDAGLYKGDITGTVDGSLLKALGQLKQQKAAPAGVSPEVAQRLGRFVTSSSSAPAAAAPDHNISAFTPAAAPPPVEINPATKAPAAAAPADAGEARIQNMVRMLGNGVDMKALAAQGPVTQATYQHAIHQLADKLAAQPNTRKMLSDYGKDKLGFDPMHNTEAEVDNFLRMVGQQVDQSAAPASANAI